MMDYGTFKTMAKEHFLEYMPDAFKSCVVRMIRVEKVNQTLDGLSLVSAKGGSCDSSPVIYMNGMYRLYQERGNLEYVLAGMAREMVRAYVRMPSCLDRSVMEKLIDRDNVILQMVNTKNNQDLLKTCPSRPFLDLTIIYKVMLYKGEGTAMGVRVTHQLAKDLGMDEEALYQAAFQNTRRRFPLVMEPLVEVLGRLYGMESAALSVPGQKKIPMYVFTNDIRIGGAAAMLYKDKLDELSRKLGADLYILPSSLHEVIVLPVYGGMLGYLEQIVFEINRTEVRPEDWLSDQVYRYNRAEQIVTAAKEEPSVPDWGLGPAVCGT